MKILTVDYSKVKQSELAKDVEVVDDYDEFMSEEEKHA